MMQLQQRPYFEPQKEKTKIPTLAIILNFTIIYYFSEVDSMSRIVERANTWIS